MRATSVRASMSDIGDTQTQGHPVIVAPAASQEAVFRGSRLKAGSARLAPLTNDIGVFDVVSRATSLGTDLSR